MMERNLYRSLPAMYIVLAGSTEFAAIYVSIERFLYQSDQPEWCH